MIVLDVQLSNDKRDQIGGEVEKITKKMEIRYF